MSKIKNCISNFACNSYIQKWIILLLILIVNSNYLFADDTGITKVRLIQETDTSYIFEVDVAQAVLWAIKKPVLPQRFRLSVIDFENQSGWITLKFKISTSEEPLSHEDEIVLPWTRNGVDITAQWKDGKTYKGLFNRTLNGIHIPLRELMPIQKTTLEVIQEGFLMGGRHLSFKIIHLLLIIVLVWAFPSFKVLGYLFMITLGQMGAMILVELGISGFDLLLSDLLFLLIILLISYSVIKKIKFKYLYFLLFTVSVCHGLSYAHEIGAIGLELIQRVQSLFAFNLTVDLGHYVLALALLVIIPTIQKKYSDPSWFPVISGSIAVFLILLIARENIFSNNLQILELQASPTSTTYKTSAQAPNMSARQVQRGTGLMTTPLMVYLSVEPFEVRQEILVQASAAIQYLNIDGKGSSTIPVGLQEQIKKGIQEAITSTDTTYINNQLVTPTDVITNFVTLSRGGVVTRGTPVEENVDEAILGITLIYEIESFPDSIFVNWQLFPDTVQSIEASAVDPHGAFTTMLSPGANTIQWKSRLVGYKVPAIEAIVVKKQPQALISFLLWLGLVLFIVYQAVYKRVVLIKPWITIVLVLSFIFYPFVRFQMNLPFMTQVKPSQEMASLIVNDLLTNVYRAFDRRNENDVYDRLALSVSNNQLSEIYMQNRQSMALENRGGARANVDDVNIQKMYTIHRDKNGGYVADTQWTVRGSVNHFGHTHYRQNQYRALVSFGIDQETWKIENIEILDTRRLY